MSNASHQLTPCLRCECERADHLMPLAGRKQVDMCASPHTCNKEEDHRIIDMVSAGPIPKRKEWGIEMDGIAQMLGLDIFDYDPGDIIRAIGKLQEFVRANAAGFDHDEDAHKYGTYCRVCIAEELAQ